jgi:hypothetical protein
MSRSDNVTIYLKRITQVCDEIVAIGDKTEDAKIMNVALNGLPKSLEPFVKGFCARESIPYWQRLSDDCIQEETREESKRSKKEDEEEENLTLVIKTRKGKGKGSNK